MNLDIEQATTEVAATENTLQPIDRYFTEAPFVVFTKLYGVAHDDSGQVIEINATARSGVSLADAIEQLFEGAKFAKQKYQLTLTNPSVKKSPMQTASIAQSKVSVSQAPASPKLSSGTVQNTGVQVIHAVKLEVTYDAEGRCTLKWYEANHKYPDIYTTRSPEKALELLQSTGEGWTSEHLEKPVTFSDIRHDIFYRLSEKVNSKGNPYKDIVEIRSA